MSKERQQVFWDKQNAAVGKHHYESIHSRPLAQGTAHPHSGTATHVHELGLGGLLHSIRAHDMDGFTQKVMPNQRTIPMAKRFYSAETDGPGPNVFFEEEFHPYWKTRGDQVKYQEVHRAPKRYTDFIEKDGPSTYGGVSNMLSHSLQDLKLERKHPGTFNKTKRFDKDNDSVAFPIYPDNVKMVMHMDQLVLPSHNFNYFARKKPAKGKRNKKQNAVNVEGTAGQATAAAEGAVEGGAEGRENSGLGDEVEKEYEPEGSSEEQKRNIVEVKGAKPDLNYDNISNQMLKEFRATHSNADAKPVFINGPAARMTGGPENKRDQWLGSHNDCVVNDEAAKRRLLYEYLASPAGANYLPDDTKQTGHKSGASGSQWGASGDQRFYQVIPAQMANTSPNTSISPNGKQSALGSTRVVPTKSDGMHYTYLRSNTAMNDLNSLVAPGPGFYTPLVKTKRPKVCHLGGKSPGNREPPGLALKHDSATVELMKRVKEVVPSSGFLRGTITRSLKVPDSALTKRSNTAATQRTRSKSQNRSPDHRTRRPATMAHAFDRALASTRNLLDRIAQQQDAAMSAAQDNDEEEDEEEGEEEEEEEEDEGEGEGDEGGREGGEGGEGQVGEDHETGEAEAHLAEGKEKEEKEVYTSEKD